MSKASFHYPEDIMVFPAAISIPEIMSICKRTPLEDSFSLKNGIP